MAYRIRQVKTEDLKQVAEVERVCFPPEEAAGEDDLAERIELFPDSFFVAEEMDGRIIGFINGCVTDRDTICDQMFENSGCHVKNGAYQSVFGLDVVEEWRRKGVASALMGRLVEETKKRGKKGVILTCKEHLIPFYGSFGFVNKGVSASVHGGAVWYDMILEFQEK